LANLKQHLSLEFKHHDAGEDARAAAMVVLGAEVQLKKPFEQITSGSGAFQLSFPF
jgi:DNA polymerase-3 subunit epsilon